MEQIVLNLVVNARDAMPDGGRLLIETETVRAPDSPPHVLLAVSDTGTGIDEATRERLFEPFFTTKEADRGTGLGLSTVYGIVSRSGGRIEVVSRPGEGARFLVYLPQAGDPGAPQRRPVDEQEPTARGETVLVVEDEAAVRTFTVRALELAGYRALAAGNVADALRTLEGTHVDIVVSDVVLPGASGLELGDLLEGREPPVPVLFMSGHAPELAERAEHPARSGFIAKPFRVEELAAGVRAVLDAREP
jgi:CheY-like chemotaxis protein